MLSKDYIVGLTDGEGSFTAYIRPPNKKYHAKNYRIECHYYLKLREEELPLLKKIKDFFGCGRISLQKDKRSNHQNCYRYEVSDLKSIREILIPFFNQNRLKSVNRERDFGLLYSIVNLVGKKAHQTKKGLQEIASLKNQMHQ